MLVRRSLVSIKCSSGAMPGVRSTSSPSGLSTPFLTLNLPQLLFHGGVCARCQAAAPATPGMSLGAVRLQPPLAPGSGVAYWGECTPDFAEGEDEDGSPK